MSDYIEIVLETVRWTPRKRECSLWEAIIGSSPLNALNWSDGTAKLRNLSSKSEAESVMG